MTQDVWKVGELAEQTGVSVRTLHYYDEIGLLSPSQRTGSGHRLYDAADLRLAPAGRRFVARGVSPWWRNTDESKALKGRQIAMGNEPSCHESCSIAPPGLGRECSPGTRG